MSNKSDGTEFEKEVAQILSDHGYWAHCLQDKKNGQPFDIITAKNHKTYVMDCKRCTFSQFVFSRIEENQELAMQAWRETGNSEGLFVIGFPNIGAYVILLSVIQELKKSGKKRICSQDMSHYGIPLETWMTISG